MNDDETRKQWARLCRMYITRGNAQIDQMVSELHAMAGIREGFEDMDAWEAMHDRAIEDMEAQRAKLARIRVGVISSAGRHAVDGASA